MIAYKFELSNHSVPKQNLMRSGFYFLFNLKNHLQLIVKRDNILNNLLNKTKYLSVLLIGTALLLSGCAGDESEFTTGGTSTLSAPNDLSVTAGDAKVTIGWTAVSGAESYSVFWGTATGITSSSSKLTNISTNYYSHDSLTNGTTYYYKVATVNSSGTSTLSSEASATPTSSSGDTTTTTTLSAPSGLTASGGSQQVVLDWSAVSGASSYIVYWDNASGITSSDTAITSITTDNYTHTSLDNGTTYYYKVAAVDSSGTGTLSSEVSANTDSAAGAATYTVTFDSNYSGGPSSTTQTVTDNVSTALTTTSFTRTDNSFAGWATSSSGGAVYNDGQSVAFSANTTLYAVWFDTSGGKTLLVHYNFDQQNASDNTSNSNDGTLYNMAFVSEGSGYAASFDGSTSEIRMPDNLIKNQTDFTVMFRFKTSSSGIMLGYQNNLAASNPGEFVHILSIAPDSGKLMGDLWSSGGHFEVISADNVSDNQWHTVYFSAKASSIALYLDGTQLGTASSTVAHLSMTKNQLGVGKFGRSVNWDGLISTQVHYYNGLIDDFKFYSGALH